MNEIFIHQNHHNVLDLFSMSSLLFLSSRDGNGDRNYNTFWNINLPRLNTLRNYKLSLQNIEFANTVYPINQYNNMLYFSENTGGPFTAVLTCNNYTGPQMATEIKTAMEAVGAGTYTVTYDSQNKKFTIAVSAGAATFTFASGLYDTYEELGFDETLFASAASHESDFPIDLSGSKYVDVVTNFSTFNHSVSSTANILVRVPLNVSFGCIVFYEPSTDDKLFITANQIDEIYLQLRDEKGNLWELPDNSHLAMTLKIDSQQ